MRTQGSRKNRTTASPSAPALQEICRTLDRTYGQPRHGNPKNPLDDLIYIIISTRTRDSSFVGTFRKLKKRFPSWDTLVPKRKRSLEKILLPGGLGKLKARQVLAIVTELKRRYGRATLAPLSKMSDADAESFLISLPGVGPKIAKCVLMYALDRKVLPVDVHVHRLASRLGFHVKRRPDTSQNLIESAIPPDLRYSFHVNAIAHGRRLCFAHKPRCHECPISTWCKYTRAK